MPLFVEIPRRVVNYSLFVSLHPSLSLSLSLSFSRSLALSLFLSLSRSLFISPFISLSGDEVSPCSCVMLLLCVLSPEALAISHQRLKVVAHCRRRCRRHCFERPSGNPRIQCSTATTSAPSRPSCRSSFLLLFEIITDIPSTLNPEA